MLDLQDYPGQGSALVGILDAFMETKGIVDPETFYGFCAPVVPLAEIKDFCWRNTQTLQMRIALSNYEENDWNTPIRWQLISDDGTWERQGTLACSAPQGNVTPIGNIELPPLGISRRPRGHGRDLHRLLTQQAGEIEISERSYSTLAPAPQRHRETKHRRHVHARLLELRHVQDHIGKCRQRSISGHHVYLGRPRTSFVPAFPHRSAHPLFRNFPTEEHSDWQWWSIARNSRPMILDNTSKTYRPVLQVIDNIERNHKLGIVFEFRIGKGKLLVCTTDLNAIQGTPEGNQFRTALLRYAKSAQFQPDTALSWEELTGLFTGTVTQRNIQGVENQSDYTKK